MRSRFPSRTRPTREEGSATRNGELAEIDLQVSGLPASQIWMLVDLDDEREFRE